MNIADAVESLVATGRVLLHRIEALEAAAHRQGDDRAYLQTEVNRLQEVQVNQGNMILTLQSRLIGVAALLDKTRAEQRRMQREMDHLRRTCYRGFKTGTAGHFLKDELWDPPV